MDPFIKSKIDELESVPRHSEEVEGHVFEHTTEHLQHFAIVVREAYIHAAKFGFDRELPPERLKLRDALHRLRQVAAWCEGRTDESPSEAATGLYDKEQAARHLGYSVSGFNKLIELARRGEIPLRFSQPVPNGKILFRREWLDEFVEWSKNKTETNTEKPPVKSARKATPSKTDETSHGLDWSLIASHRGAK